MPDFELVPTPKPTFDFETSISSGFEQQLKVYKTMAELSSVSVSETGYIELADPTDIVGVNYGPGKFYVTTYLVLNVYRFQWISIMGALWTRQDFGAGWSDWTAPATLPGANPAGMTLVSDGTNWNTKATSITAISDTIPIRDSNGRFQSATPLANADVANKQYVDSAAGSNTVVSSGSGAPSFVGSGKLYLDTTSSGKTVNEAANILWMNRLGNPEVIMGNTGWRYLSGGVFPNHAGTEALIRRVDDRVTFIARVSTLTLNQLLYTLPQGFKGPTRIQTSATDRLLGTDFTCVNQGAHGITHDPAPPLVFKGDSIWFHNTSVTGPQEFRLEWYAKDSWPFSYPGSAGTVL